MPIFNKGDKVSVGATTPVKDLTKLDQTISATPTQAEVQAISDKVDALIDALQAIAQ